MKFNKKITAIMSMVLASSLFLSGCGSNNENTEQNSGPNNEIQAESIHKDSVIIAMGVNSEPEAGFDPAYGWGAGEHMHEPLIQSTLTVTTADLQIDYDLATDITVTEDGMLWTVVIRDDVYFTDGEKLTASDVAFTYNTVKDTSSVNDFTMLNYAEAEDENTVLFHMNTPYSIWPYSMAVVGIVPEHAYNEEYGLNPIGSGRYILKQWDKGQQVILEANPDYYGGEPLMKNVTVVFMSEDTAFAAVQAGQVDLAETSASFSEQVIDGYELLSVETVDNRGFNMPAIAYNGEAGNNVTSDIAVRRAINIGLNRELMIDNVLNGHGTAAYSVSDKMPWFSEDMIVAYDFEEAVSILEEGGWNLGDDGIRVKEGLRAEFNILYPSGDSVRQALAAEASNQMKLLGIEATFEGVGWDTAYSRAQSEVMTWGWGAHTPMEMYNIYHTAPSGLAEYSPYANSTVDEYMDGALRSSDLEESYELWQLAQFDGEAGIAVDVPWIWLVNIDHLYWSRDTLQVAEQKLHPHGHGWSIVNNVDQWIWE